MPEPTASMTAESGVPSSISPTSGATTSPTTVTTMVPGDSAVPMLRNQSAPLAMMWGTLLSVSALLTRVGFDSARPRRPGSGSVASQPSCGAVANNPCSYGGSRRGSGAPPSMTSSSAFSSPKRYSSGPWTIVTAQSVQMPAACISVTARVTASIAREQLALSAMNASAAPTANPAMTTPSTSWYGLARSRARSLNV